MSLYIKESEAPPGNFSGQHQGTLEAEKYEEMLLDSLRWRYATKKFNPQRLLSSDQVKRLLEATNLAASAAGLQPFQVLIIETRELRDSLRTHAFNQSQVTDASHLLLFCYETNLSEARVDRYIQRTAKVRGVSSNSLAGLKEMVLKWIARLGPAASNEWAARQCYIALGVLLTACSVAKIDACPMEGFDSKGVSDTLELDKRDLYPAVMVAIGFRSRDDERQNQIKVRKSMDEIVTYC